MKRENDDGNFSWRAWNSPQRLGKKRGSQKKNQDYPDHSIAKIGQNTQKSHGDLKRFAVTHT